jgi:hypothetical protein
MRRRNAERCQNVHLLTFVCFLNEPFTWGSSYLCLICMFFCEHLAQEQLVCELGNMIWGAERESSRECPYLSLCVCVHAVTGDAVDLKWAMMLSVNISVLGQL